ncbi:hypothetical protein F3Y22_tig00110676pilonHSYRG00358 [Hibiscus syriacus]|uniref:indole-3-pyruvate monooxygenase n=1 Tax=Hibiscus syriacus TaxID=106335 RepID=A0A6A2ZYU9_HIBSY|nr:hypothetical protein F3Y22_tig00110676pilonHSYRG00358 [Hibiscus syriacus]
MTVSDVTETEVYTSRFLVVATEENSEGLIHGIDGLESYGGECIHSSQYGNGRKYRGKNVLVVSCGNSGMEIAYDLWNWVAKTSIVTRNPVHVLTKEMVKMAMVMYNTSQVHSISSKYPVGPPSSMSKLLGRSKPEKSKSYRALNALMIKSSLRSQTARRLDSMPLFSPPGTRAWSKFSSREAMRKGCPRNAFRITGEGENGTYNAGFSRRGLQGVSRDAQNIARDIHLLSAAALGFNN